MTLPKLFVCVAEPSDLRELVRLERATNTHPWTEEHFREALADEHSRCVLLKLAESDGQRVLGHCVIQTAADEAEVHALAIDPAWRRRGLGRLLLRSAVSLARIAGARAVLLEVRARNDAALRLYQSSGFTRVGRRRDYYREPVDDALLLRSELRPTHGGRCGDRPGTSPN